MRVCLRDYHRQLCTITSITQVAFEGDMYTRAQTDFVRRHVHIFLFCTRFHSFIYGIKKMVMNSFKICLQLSSIKSINVPYFSVLAIQNFPLAVIPGKNGGDPPKPPPPPPPFPSLGAYVRMLSIVVSEGLY
ncbi:unnamed protein product [Ixodes pacificus]